MKREDRNAYVNYRLEKSEETFDVALLLVENRKWNSAMNRLYYAAFYAVSALLAKSGLPTKTHAGVKSNFALHYVKSGKVEDRHGKTFASLFSWRHKGDYADFVDFSESDILAMVEPTKELIEAVRRELAKPETL